MTDLLTGSPGVGNEANKAAKLNEANEMGSISTLII